VGAAKSMGEFMIYKMLLILIYKYYEFVDLNKKSMFTNFPETNLWISSQKVFK